MTINTKWGKRMHQSQPSFSIIPPIAPSFGSLSWLMRFCKSTTLMCGVFTPCTEIERKASYIQKGINF